MCVYLFLFCPIYPQVKKYPDETESAEGAGLISTLNIATFYC